MTLETINERIANEADEAKKKIEELSSKVAELQAALEREQERKPYTIRYDGNRLIISYEDYYQALCQCLIDNGVRSRPTVMECIDGVHMLRVEIENLYANPNLRDIADTLMSPENLERYMR